MKIQLESTTKIVALNGIKCRVWEGVTSGGIAIHAFISRVAVKEGQPAAVYEQFERELTEQRKPSADVEAIPMRMIL